MNWKQCTGVSEMLEWHRWSANDAARLTGVVSLTEQLQEAEEVTGEFVVLHDLLTCAAAESDSEHSDCKWAGPQTPAVRLHQHRALTPAPGLVLKYTALTYQTRCQYHLFVLDTRCFIIIVLWFYLSFDSVQRFGTTLCSI